LLRGFRRFTRRSLSASRLGLRWPIRRETTVAVSCRPLRTSVGDALRMLELNEARWQAVLATARDAIISIDRSGRITLFNQAVA